MRRNVSVIATLFILLVCFAAALAGAQAKIEPSQEIIAAPIYNKRCATCHGKDGRAKTFKAKFNKARNLTDAQWQSEVTDERLFNSISHGRGKMPAFAKKLSDAQIEALVAYVRSLKR